MVRASLLDKLMNLAPLQLDGAIGNDLRGLGMNRLSDTLEGEYPGKKQK